MHEAWVLAAELVVRLPQEHGGASATHMIEPKEWREDLPSAVLVVRDKRPVRDVGAGRHVGFAYMRLAISGRLHDDWPHRLTVDGLRPEPLGKFKGGLKTFVL